MLKGIQLQNKMRHYLCVCFLIFSSVKAFPGNGYRYIPQRAVMFGGYYGQPLSGRNYVPEASMSGFALGDTIATNSFISESERRAELDETSEEYTEIVKPSRPEAAITEEEDSDVELSTTVKPKRVPKYRPQKPVQEEEEKDEDSPSFWPFPNNKNGPSYNALFPIVIGGGGGGRGLRGRSSEDSEYPASAIAIANSYSTGKGGVATSHATSFGDPYLSSLLRNIPVNTKKRAFKEEK